MTPYVPHTVWVSTTPRLWKAAPAPFEKRAYKKGSMSRAAREILGYVRTNPGALTKDLKTGLKLSSVSQQIKCLREDGLITVTFHDNPTGRPLMRCWPTG